MAINSTDLKLYQSEVNDDSANGGGRMSSVEIVDGVLNNLFTDKSRLDKTLGRVSIRFAHFTAASDNDDEVLGKHVILTRPPADTDIDVVAYAAASASERRRSAQQRIQRYDVAPGSVLVDAALVGTVTPGATQIDIAYNPTTGATTYRRRNPATGQIETQAALATTRQAVGMLIQLTNTDTGDSETFAITQYSSANEGSLNSVMTIGLDRQVQGTFDGIPAGTSDYNVASNTIIRYMGPGAAARDDTYFYGVSPIGAAITNGDETATVTKPLVKLCPDDLTYADVIGLAPLALPAGNLVPIFRTGQAVVIHHSADYTVPDNPAIAGTTYNVGRTDLSYLELRDQLGVRVTTDKYTPDLAAGTFEMANPLDLTGYVQPLVATHMIENRRIIKTGISDANGTVKNLGPLEDLVTNSPHTLDAGGITLFRGVAFGTTVLSSPYYSSPSQHFTWTIDEGAGTITFGIAGTWYNPSTVDVYALYRTENTGTLEFDRAVDRDFPNDGNTYISTIYPIGDRRAAAQVLFSESAFISWSDLQQVADTTGQFDDLNYPVVVTNAGAVTDRWRISFTGGADFEVIGEDSGLVATGSTAGPNIAPINPATGAPFFTIDFNGFGGGWVVGNQIRFNTTAEASPLVLIRVTQPGDDSVVPTDDVRAMFRADSNE